MPKLFNTITLSIPANQYITTEGGKLRSVKTLTKTGNIKSVSYKKAINLQTNKTGDIKIISAGKDVDLTKKSRGRPKKTTTTTTVVTSAPKKRGRPAKYTSIVQTIPERPSIPPNKEKITKVWAETLKKKIELNALKRVFNTLKPPRLQKKRGRPVGSKNKK